MPVTTVELKLKQASAVLGVSPKELQNLVQLKVISPRRKDNLYWFDGRLLLEAKVAFYLKESLGSSSELLSLFTDALSRSIAIEDPKSRRFISLQSLPPRGQQPIEIRIPLGSLAREVEEQMPQSLGQDDLPRGRRRAGWREEIRQAFGDAAKQMGDVQAGDILAAVRAHRRRPRVLPEVTVVANRSRKTA
jgi:hypothetical protein